MVSWGLPQHGFWNLQGCLLQVAKLCNIGSTDWEFIMLTGQRTILPGIIDAMCPCDRGM